MEPPLLRPPLRRVPGKERRGQLLGIAREIILRSGIGALTMESLAEAAGVTKPIAYKHFDNSEAVTLAVLDEYASRSIAFTLARVEGARDLDEFFDKVIESLFEYVRDNGALSRNITTGFSSTARIDACFQEMSSRARRIYSRILQDQGVPAARAELAGYALMEMINSTILEFAAIGDPSHQDTLKEMVRGTLRTLVKGKGSKPAVPAYLLGSGDIEKS